MSIWRWNDWIEPVAPEFQITLGEGNTPLIRSTSIGPQIGIENLWFKLETGNPAGSFKDRFGAAAISHMLAAGKTKCIATSSGNTGAALAAYSAAAGIDCRIAIVETAPMGKLKQMLAYGARIARFRDFGISAEKSKEIIHRLQQIGVQPGWALQVSAYVYSHAGMSGVQTIAYELAEQAESPPDHVFCPAGGGGLCVAVARGFQQLVQRDRLQSSPAVECVQPSGNDTIAGPLRDGAERARPVKCTSRISGLQVASVIDGDLALDACRDSCGTGHLADDEAIWEVQKRLAREEGIFTEPAGATSVAGALQAVAENRVRADANIVCLVTGTGFKDDASVDRMISDVECPLLDADQLDQWQDS